MRLMLLVMFLSLQGQPLMICAGAIQQQRRPGIVFRIAISKKKCGSQCVVVLQTLKNEGEAPVAVRTISVASMTGLMTEVHRNPDGSIAPGGGGSAGEAWRPPEFEKQQIHCKVLKPGERFRTTAEVSIPDAYPKGSSMYLDQEYADFQPHQCDGVDFFQGAAKSNRIKFLYQ